ncbi:uncharacterized protein LOC106092816 [Stomoxys calcitrans]|uniref:uncharacterized protein LOC106092816 n=1 Tax=Stomoxys calcitrans TaxID=35570 RepID=UPI0027E38EA4|nr:uncharacterized protein LOC106092816 [Stomoxys calcitrans]
MFSTLWLVAVFHRVFLWQFISCQETENHTKISLNVMETNLKWRYETFLNAIREEKPFESLLIIHQQQYKEKEILEIFTKYQADEVPKCITMESNLQSSYKSFFNSEILAIILMADRVGRDLMHNLAQTLDYMRQTRVFMVITNINNFELFKDKMLNFCETLKLSNVLMSFHSNSTDSSIKLFRLKPYPNYHWQLVTSWGDKQHPLYPQHWLNLHNKTLLTYPDQFAPKTLVFADEQAQLHISGYVGLLLTAFAKHYNAHLQMYKPLVEGHMVHFKDIVQMVADGLLDVPMSTEGGGSGSWQNMSDYILVNKAGFMVPLSTQLSISEIFALLLDGYFFGCFLVFSLLLSFALALTDLLFEGTLEYLNFVINSKVMPGVLGQAFVNHFTKLIGLRMLYFFIGFVGLNISTQFAANINSLFTSPPYHKQLETFSDLEHSNIKLLIQAPDLVIMYAWVEENPNIFISTQNSTEFLTARLNLNTSHGYVIQSELWEMYNRRQEYFRRKVFHTTPHLNFASLMMWGLPLQKDSLYREALNHFIQNVHNAGLMNAWRMQTYLDMSKLKRLPMHDPNQEEQSKVLKVFDFLWVWTLLAIGWLSSLLAFLMELLIHRVCGRKSN